MKNTHIIKLIMSAATLYLAPISVFAQSPITLSAKNVAALQPGIYHGRVVNTASLTPPSIGTNMTWDYANLKASPVYANSLIKADTFSSTAVADTTATETIGGSFVIPVTAVYDMDTNGFYGAGAVITKQTYVLSSPTGTIVVPAQVYKYRRNYLSFPMTYNTVWQSKISHAINFNVSIPSYYIADQPANKVSHSTVTDSVVGWGTLTIPSANKSSVPYPVLLVKEKTQAIDSFFLDGVQVPPQLLDSLGGLYQGMLTNSYSEYFFRAGTVEPMLTIGYDTDYTYTNPSTAEYTADNVQSGIENVQPYHLQTLSIFPNPAEGGLVQCSFNKTVVANWHLNLINSLGEVVSSQTVSGTGNIQERIDVSHIRSGGLYYITVIDKFGQIAASGNLSLER